MDLRRSFERFASLELSYINPATDALTSAGAVGSMQVYDRFVSDRDFGMKKRLFLIPGQFTPDYSKLAFVTGASERWLLEGTNEDMDTSGVYATVLVLREAPFKLSLKRMTGGTTRASGVGKVVPTLVEYAVTYGDFSRYSGNESSEFDNVDYSVVSWYMPDATDIDLDTTIVDSKGVAYTVKEVTRFLNLTLVRAQEQEAA